MKPLSPWTKAGLVLWMLAHPALYFLLIASPRPGGFIAMLPDFVHQLHQVLIPFFVRNSVF